MTSEVVLHDWLSQAEDALDRHSLEEASRAYHKVLMGGHNLGHGCCLQKYSVAALIGLSSVYSKTGRSLRYQVLEWQGMLLCAAAFLNEALSRCTRELADGRECAKCRGWLQTAREKAAYQRDILHKCIANSIQETVKVKAGEVVVNMDWLLSLQAYSRGQCAKLSPKSPDTDDTTGQDNLNVTRDKDNNVNVEEDANANIVNDSTQASTDAARDKTPREGATTKKRRSQDAHINFDQVQAAIMRLVKQVSTDIRKRHVRKRISEDMLRRSVSCEMLTRSLPASDRGGDLWSTESTLGLNNCGEESETDSAGEDEEPDQDLPTNPKYDELLLSCPCIFLAAETEEGDGQRLTCERMVTGALVDANYNIRESAPPRTSTSAQHQRPHILTIWRSHPQENRPAPPAVPPYSLPSFEELSPLTESASFRQPPPAGEGGAPVNVQHSMETRINHTLATLLQDVAGGLQAADRPNEAEDVLKFALGLVEYAGSGPPDAATRVISGILHSLGIIKCGRGDVTGGARLMEEAVSLLETAGGQQRGLIAEIWHSLGDAYVVNLAQDGALMEHVMRTVREHLDSEVIYDGQTLELDTDSDTSEGETYSVCIYEAIGCYNQAHAMLARPSVRERYLDLYVDNLRRLGDCHIMVGNYDSAIACYEEVIKLVKSTFGAEALLNNAHVLSMLGMANFLLGNYHKAISILETAYILQQQADQGGGHGEECLFLLMLMGIAYFMLTQFHKSISWCLKAEECAQHTHSPAGPALSALRSWFLAEVLFMLGFSYSTVSFLPQALTYLRQARDIIVNESVEDTKLNVRVLKAIADAYAGLEQNEEAIEYYNLAIDVVAELGQERSATALQNQLLNAMAGVHVSSNQYGHASQYLEQGLSCQKSVESSINSDLFTIMHRLGVTYTITGDIERAMECYSECLSSRGELPGEDHEDLSLVLCSMGNLCLVRSCMEEEGPAVAQLLAEARGWYEEAIKCDRGPASAVQYASFLYQQGEPAEALLTLLPVLGGPDTDTSLTYHGVCHAILPEHVHIDIDDVEEVTFSAGTLAYFLGIICYKSLGLEDDAWQCLEQMVFYVYNGYSGMNFSFLAYALMEMGLFLEAAESFALAAVYLDNKESARANFWLSLCTAVYKQLQRAFINIWLFA